MEAIEFLAPRANVLRSRDAIIRDLADLLPPEGLVHEARRLVPFETDGFTAYRRLPLAVALPETTAQVAAVLKYCKKMGVPVIPRARARRCRAAPSRRKMRWSSVFPR